MQRPRRITKPTRRSDAGTGLQFVVSSRNTGCRKDSKMAKRLVVAAITLAVAMFPMAKMARAQSATQGLSGTAKDQAGPASTPAFAPDDESEHLDGWYRPVPKPTPSQKSGPAPLHDISGTWEPAEGWRNGVQSSGAYNYPSDGKHPLPYTLSRALTCMTCEHCRSLRRPKKC
jgi:hypothetical protein